MWVPFNEGWGPVRRGGERQGHPLHRRTRAPSTTPAAWHDQGIGEIKSIHLYFDDYRYAPDKLGPLRGAQRVRRLHLRHRGPLGGGQALRLQENSRPPPSSARGWSCSTTGRYAPPCATGLSAAVYTQLTDVENELNGLITYDRRVLKLAPEAVERTVRMPALRP